MPYKNCDQFLKCIAHLKGEFPILKASIIGDGPNRKKLEDLTRELNLSEIVSFIGQVEQEQLRPYYQGLDVLIVPSSNEPFGLVVLESVACGTPAVVAKSGGLEELIQPPFIIGFEVNNIYDLKIKVTEVLGQVHDTGFGMASNEYVRQQYSLRAYIQRLEEIYHLVIHNNC